MADSDYSIQASSDWLDRMAQAEDEASSISVGGLAFDSGMLSSALLEATHILGHVIELARRDRRLSHEELAQRADLQLLEVLSLEHMHSVRPARHVVVQCARALDLPEGALIQLAEMPSTANRELLEAAFRFMSSSESTKRLSREERSALVEFKGVLASGSAEY